MPNKREQQQTRLNVPALRFPEFKGEWKTYAIGEILSIGSGRDYKQLELGDTPVFGTGGLMTRVNQCLMEGESVFIGRKGTINRPFYYCGKFWTVDTLFYTHSFINVIPKFVLYLFETIDWLKYNEASGVPSLSKSTIEKIIVKLPSIAEQTKIARLLTILDDRIATQRKIIEDLKKLRSTIGEKLFCSPKDKQPKARLHGFSDVWHYVRLSDICDRIRIKNIGEQCKRVLTIAAQYGLVSQEEFFHKNVASENLSNYYLLKKGDFAYNKSYSGDYAWGAVKRLDNYEQGVLSPLYICFHPNSDKVDSDFLVYYFESKKWHKAVADIAGEGARNHGLLNISIMDYFNTIHCIPSMKEQKQIAMIMNALSLKATHEQHLLNCYIAQRQYLLQQLFI
ncbi:restriction endonuclease subunit S [bacterium]|nr:restriction endonuclease subunit S [bacterium]